MRAVPMDATLSAYVSEHRLVPFSPIFIHDIASAGLKWVIFDAAALGPFKKQAHGHRRDNKKVFSILVVISLVGTVSGKSLKLLPQDVIF